MAVAVLNMHKEKTT